jgi:iron(III) transport system permease protein
MRRRRADRPVWLIVTSAVIALVLLLPLAFLLVEAEGAGVSKVVSLINRPLTAHLLWNTVRLTVAVSALSTVIGTGAAWLVERTNLPGRRFWSVLLVVPLAIPDFVISFGWASLSKDISGFQGAVLVMTLAVYPLVYLLEPAERRPGPRGGVAEPRGEPAQDVLAGHDRAVPRRHPGGLPARGAGPVGGVRGF